MDILAHAIFENNSEDRKINNKNFWLNTILYGYIDNLYRYSDYNEQKTTCLQWHTSLRMKQWNNVFVPDVCCAR